LNIHVLVGPSLSSETVREIIPYAIIHPPAKQGSIYNLIESTCDLILLIDGLFHFNASVWHREIIAAIQSGIDVYGCSSMGALRACELSRYGMIGVGRVYDYYRSGVIDGDDEVAIIHCSEEKEYEGLTLPLVSLRWNLSLLKQKGKITSSDEFLLIKLVKQMPYNYRTWAEIIKSNRYSKLMSEENLIWLKGLLLCDWQDPKSLDAIDALKIVGKVCKTNGLLEIKNDNPQPDYISDGINRNLDLAKNKIRIIGNDSQLQQELLDIVCIFKFVAPLVISPLKETHNEISTDCFAVRRAKQYCKEISNIVVTIIDSLKAPEKEKEIKCCNLTDRKIQALKVCIGYLCLTSGIGPEGIEDNKNSINLCYNDYYLIGCQVISMGADLFGLKTSREDLAFSISAIKVLEYL